MVGDGWDEIDCIDGDEHDRSLFLGSIMVRLQLAIFWFLLASIKELCAV